MEDCTSENSAASGDACDAYGLDNSEIAFLRAVSDNNVHKAAEIARDCKKMPEALAEKINEAFADNFGDVVLEESDEGGYKVIDDYTEEISEWLQKILK